MGVGRAPPGLCVVQFLLGSSAPQDRTEGSPSLAWKPPVAQPGDAAVQSDLGGSHLGASHVTIFISFCFLLILLEGTSDSTQFCRVSL